VYKRQVNYPDAPVVIRLIQPNAAQHLKWQPDWIPLFFRRALNLTRHHSDPKPDVVIWPETSIPFLHGRNTVAMQAIADAAGPDTEVIAGIRRREGARLYNSALYLDAAGGVLDIYDKHHLVPFGEYVPLAWIWARFGIFGLATDGQSGFSPGPGPRIIEGQRLPDFLPMICYEAIFARDADVRGQRPAWLLHLTNDAWFGAAQGPYQHLAQTRARAIEQGLPLVRVANTGVSALISPLGAVLDHIPMGEQGALSVRLPAPRPPTLYARLDDWPWALLALLMLGNIWRGRQTASQNT